MLIFWVIFFFFNLLTLYSVFKPYFKYCVTIVTDSVHLFSYMRGKPLVMGKKRKVYNF